MDPTKSLDNLIGNSLDARAFPKTSWKEYAARAIMPLGSYVPFKADKAKGYGWSHLLLEKTEIEITKGIVYSLAIGYILNNFSQ